MMEGLPDRAPSLGDGVRIVPASQAKVRFIDAEPAIPAAYKTNKDGTITIDPFAPMYPVWILKRDGTPDHKGWCATESDAKKFASFLRQRAKGADYAIGSDRQTVVDYAKITIQIPPEERKRLEDIQFEYESKQKGSKK